MIDKSGSDEQVKRYAQEIDRLRARIAELERVLVHSGLAFDEILHELGIPGEDYPAPVSNAVDFAKEALAEIKSVLGKGE